MKIKSRLFKILRITAIFSVIALIGFSMIACDPEPNTEDEPENITVTITGDFTKFNGWKANIAFSAPGEMTLAYAAKINVISSTTSLTFDMLDYDTNQSFNASGTYELLLWFERLGNEDSDYVLENKQINNGTNAVSFLNFTFLSYGPDKGVFYYYNYSNEDCDETVLVELFYGEGLYKDQLYMYSDPRCPKGYFLTFPVPANTKFYFRTTDIYNYDIESGYIQVGKGKSLTVTYDGYKHTYPGENTPGLQNHNINLSGFWVRDSGGDAKYFIYDGNEICLAEILPGSGYIDTYIQVISYNGTNVSAVLFLNSYQYTFTFNAVVSGSTLTISGLSTVGGINLSKFNGAYSRDIG